MSSFHQPTSSDALSPATAFSLLDNERRRETVSCLAGRSDPVTLEELASTLVSRRVAAGGAASPQAARKETKATLHHVHLPKLADADVIEYDTDENTVTPTNVDELVDAANRGLDL